MELQPHQQRVVDEKTELDDKRTKLKAFIDGNAIFAGLPDDEKERLVCAGLFAERSSCGTADARLQRRNKMSDTLKLQQAAEGGCPPATCCPLPGEPKYADHMRARNRRENIEPEPYRAPLQIAGFVTAGWLESQARDAEANGRALVEKRLACAADAWFALANAYRIEAELLFSDNVKRHAPMTGSAADKQDKEVLS